MEKKTTMNNKNYIQSTNKRIYDILNENYRIPTSSLDSAALRQVKSTLNKYIKRLINNGDLSNNDADGLVDLLVTFESAVRDSAITNEKMSNS